MWVDESVASDENAGSPLARGIVGSDVEAQSGTWSYDRDTLNQIAKEWRQLEADCREATTNARPMQQVVGPGLDFASAEMAQKANTSGSDYIRMVGEMADYAGAQADACEKALGIYEETEDDRSDFFSGLFGNIESQQRESGAII